MTEFRESGRVLKEWNFDVGYRRYAMSVNVTWAVVDETPIIIVGTDTWPDDTGYISGRQYYAKIADRWDLIRIENVRGEARRNEYIGDFRCGPPLVKQSSEAWQADLKSADQIRVLRALVWLGGKHLDLKETPRTEWQREDRKDALLARELRENQKVIVRLRELAKGDDRWLREAAKLALQPPDR